jgi:hypothetical protein
MVVQPHHSYRSIIFPDPPQPAGAKPGNLRFVDSGGPFMEIPAVGEVLVLPGDELMLEFDEHVPGQIDALVGMLDTDVFNRIDVFSGALSRADLLAIGRSRVRELRLGEPRDLREFPEFGGSRSLEFLDGADLLPLWGLHHFEARGIPFTEENLATFGSPNLEYLHLADISVDLSGLSRFKRLWNLGIQGAGFGSDLSFLKWTPTIGGLDVRFSGLETSDLSQLDHCPNLVALVLGYNRGIGPDLSTLRGWRNMVVLDLSTTGADDTTLETIGRLVSLEQLHAQCTAITDAGLYGLKSFANLRYLNLAGTDVTDDGLAVIVETLPDLTNLNVGATNITSQGAEQLLPRLKKVRTIGLSGDVATVEFAERIKAETTLTQIEVYPPTSDPDVFWEALDIIGAAHFNGPPV